MWVQLVWFNRPLWVPAVMGRAQGGLRRPTWYGPAAGDANLKDGTVGDEGE